MSRFVQIHMLKGYPPANLNRDDLGRPKTCFFGGKERLRISSQCLKRTWRTSDAFQSALKGHIGKRSARFASDLVLKELEGAIGRDAAEGVAAEIAKRLGKPDGKGKTKQLAMLSGEEEARIHALVRRAKNGESLTSDDYDSILGYDRNTVDVALFGRMLADTPKHNVDGAAMVAHALTTHAVTVEDDYFTAVDDLNDGSEDLGAGHIGVSEFSEGLFYAYVCVDREQLLANLGANEELTSKAIQALVEAMATTSPSGKQHSFAALSRADYILVEKGDQLPRTLAGAFLRPVPPHGEGYLAESIRRLRELRAQQVACYGALSDDHAELVVPQGEGTLADISAFAGSV